MSELKHAFKVLLLTEPDKQQPVWTHHNFFPGSRKKNYLELLSGLGIPFECRSIDGMEQENLIRDGVVRYSAIIFAIPFDTISLSLQSSLLDYSSQHGVTLLADSFLVKNNANLAPAFGLQRNSGLRFGQQTITDKQGRVLYQTRNYPFSARGKESYLTARPVARMLLQSWVAKKPTFDQGADHQALYNDNIPAVTSFCYGEATNYLLNFHPAMVLSGGNQIHRKIAAILTDQKGVTAVTFDLDNTVCLRLDDPGSSERVHLENFNPGVLSGDEWMNLAQSLHKEKVHLSIAFVPQWVDDGNPERGTLIYQGELVHPRQPGHIYPSREVVYTRKGMDYPTHDYVSEFKAIKRGVEVGAFSIIAHGLTHISTDIEAWLRAPDKHSNMKWYREFREMAGGKQPEYTFIEERFHENRKTLKEDFGRLPTVIVPPAHEHSDMIIHAAQQAGFQLFSSRATYLLGSQGVITNRKLMAFYPNDFNSAKGFSLAGYPVIFVCHDYDLFRNGTDWLLSQVEKLRESGIKKFISLEVLASLLLAEIEVVGDINATTAIITFPGGALPAEPDLIIPVKIACQSPSVTINDHPFTGDMIFKDDFTRIQVHSNEIDSGQLKISINHSTDSN